MREKVDREAILLAVVMPIAMASAGWAAIGAIGGAFVGATAGGFVDLATRWATDRKLAKTGARLVAADLRRTDYYLQDIEDSGKWSETSSPPISNWPEYRFVLAGRLKGPDFEVLATTMLAVEDMVRIHERPEIKFGQEVDLPSDVIEGTTQLRAQLAHAYNSLAALGGLGRVEDRIVKGSGLAHAIEAEASEEA